jgi:hypothetical protein
MSAKDLFVQKEDGSVIYNGNKLIAYVPVHYETYSLFRIDKYVVALGIFDMEADGQKIGIQVPAAIEMSPSEIEDIIIDGENFKQLTFFKGDTFMIRTDVVKTEKVGYYLWTEFIGLGRFPKFINYDRIFYMLDDLKEVTGRGIDASHTLLEIVYQHLYRDKDDINKLYRLTNMTKPARLLNMRNISQIAQSNHSKIFGAYSADGINSALVNQNTKNNEFEDMYRQ